MNIEKLKFNNGYGTFDEKENEYWIMQNKESRVPLAWSNILANENFGTVVTDSMGGFTWYKNSQTNKVTQFSNDAFLDTPSENISIKVYEKIPQEIYKKSNLNIYEKIPKDISQKSNQNIYEKIPQDISQKTQPKTYEKISDFNFKNMSDEGNYYTCFGLGYAKYFHKSDALESEITIFVPTNINAKIMIVQLKNTSEKNINVSAKYETKMQLAENLDKSILVKKYKESLNSVFYKNLKKPNYIAYVTSNEKIDENQTTEVTLNKNEEKEILFLLGCEEDEEEIVKNSIKIFHDYEKIFLETKKYWKEKTSHFISKTPSKEFDIMQNGWIPYQTLTSRLLARTGYYQVSGAYGFRDQLQDAIGMKWVDPNILRKQILTCANHQFQQGDCEHWFHPNSERELGIKAEYSDDPIWLLYATNEYINFTGDYSILAEKTPFLDYPSNDNKEELGDEIVDYFPQTKKKYSLLKHLIKSIEFSSKLGKHKLPLIRRGDWNDAMSNIGNNAKGESVWLAFFIYLSLEKFIKILENIIKKHPTLIDDCSLSVMQKLVDKYKRYNERLKININKKCWDGKWFIRGYDKNGNVIGTNQNVECKIDSISQSFSVISNAGDNDKKYIAMKSLEDNLIDEKNSIVKLLTPPIENNELGYISSYAKGMRENGGEYVHAAVWAMIAEAILKKPKEVEKIYKCINPIYRTQSKFDIEKYKVEPYVIPADIYSEGNLLGRGGWTWYTGASSWLYEAQIKYILGINIENGKLYINPCVPDSFNKYQVTFRWKKATYTLNFLRTGSPSINNFLCPYTLKSTGNYELSITF